MACGGRCTLFSEWRRNFLPWHCHKDFLSLTWTALYSGTRQEMRDLQMAKANVARLLGYDEKEPEKEKEAQRKEQR